MPNPDINEITDQLIEKYNLVPHTEGGFYAQIGMSDKIVSVSERYGIKANTDVSELPEQIKFFLLERKRPAFTRIIFLLRGNDYSTWHRLKSDETWEFKEGTSLMLYILDENEPQELKIIKIGDPAEEIDAKRQYTVKHGLWFAACLTNKNSFSFVTCEVKPGFVFNDFDLGTAELLTQEFSNHAEIIKLLAKNTKELKIPNESHRITVEAI